MNTKHWSFKAAVVGVIFVVSMVLYDIHLNRLDNEEKEIIR